MTRPCKLIKKYTPSGFIECDIPAIFHEFGVDYEEFEVGTGNFSVAIIEMLDGSVISAPLNTFIFTGKGN
jgi:hypothetical protein